MRRMLLTLIFFCVVGIMMACGSADDTNETTIDNENNETTTEEVETNDDVADTQDEISQSKDDTASNSNAENDQSTNNMGEKMQEIGYAEFELEVEYSGDKEYEAEIEKDSSGAYKAELEDELNNIHLKGDDAFNEIYPLLKEVSIDSDSSQEEVFDEVLKAFNLDADYEEIEVEITFKDGTELEYEVEKN